MSKLQVDTIYAKDALNGPDFPAGATVTGVVTATSFSGSGANLTNLPGQVDLWTKTAAGINTLSSVGLGTTNPVSDLTVGPVGTSGTSLFVHGDARVVGVLSVGQGTITLDPTAKTLTGIDELKIARATFSSLNDHKSTIEPPPLAITKISIPP